MTPKEKNDTFKVFAEIKSGRTKQLIDAVLKDDLITAREIAKRMLQDDEVLNEVTKHILQDPTFTKNSAIELTRTRVQAQNRVNTATTAWERILDE